MMLRFCLVVLVIFGLRTAMGAQSNLPSSSPPSSQTPHCSALIAPNINTETLFNSLGESRRNKIRVIFATGSETDVQRASRVFGQDGILVAAVSESIATAMIAKRPVDPKGRYITYGVLRLNDHQTEFTRFLLSGNETKSHPVISDVKDSDLIPIVQEYLRQGKPADLKFSPQGMQETIDFKNDPHQQLVAANSWTRLLDGSWFDSFFAAVLNSGFFQKAPRSTRERLYWFPGLNAGATLTPKNDSLDEAIFVVHNMFHFLESDLIPVDIAFGRHSDVYVRHRVMGEAVTMVFSDMIFVEMARRLKPDYPIPEDWIIGALYRELGIDPFDMSPQGQIELKEILWANTVWAVDGDEGPWRHLVKVTGGNMDVLERFFSKYRSMFDSDLEWSRRNAQYFIDNSAQIDRWHNETFDFHFPTQSWIVPQLSVRLQADHHGRRLTRDIFDYFFHNRIEPLLHTKLQVDDLAVRRFKGLTRYISGQLALFINYSHLPVIAGKIARIKELYKGLDGRAEVAAVDRIRMEYNLGVDHLFEQGLINADDQNMFKQTYPLMPPVFVSGKYSSIDIHGRQWTPTKPANFDDETFNLANSLDPETEAALDSWYERVPEFVVTQYLRCREAPQVSQAQCDRNLFLQFLAARR